MILEVVSDVLMGIDWQALGTVAAAIAGALIAHFLRKGERRAKALDAFDKYRRELMDFTNDVISAMSQAEILIKTNPARSPASDIAGQRFFEQRIELMSKLSSMVDRGRFLFPNHEIAGIGENKGDANQGLRDPVLNRVLAAHQVVKAVDYQDYGQNSRKLILHEFASVDDCRRMQNQTEKKLCKAFKLLSDAERRRLCGLEDRPEGVRLLDMMVAAKRSFVSEIFTVIQPQDWLANVEQSHGIQLRSRQPERVDAELAAVRTRRRLGTGVDGA